ncbi:MAG: hypothetical protein Q7U78_02360 [Gallionella sp.]|nr:hypothetical protein [Gallionella sp.]
MQETTNARYAYQPHWITLQKEEFDMRQLKQNNVNITVLRQAAIDAAVELDWTKNEPTISQETRERAQRIVKRVFVACEALDAEALA